MVKAGPARGPWAKAYGKDSGYATDYFECFAATVRRIGGTDNYSRIGDVLCRRTSCVGKRMSCFG